MALTNPEGTFEDPHHNASAKEIATVKSAMMNPDDGISNSPFKGEAKSPVKFQVRSQSTDFSRYHGGRSHYVTDPNKNSGAHLFASGNMFHSDTRSTMSNRKRITDGTSERELYRALNTFLNMTGAADYTLPKLTGQRVVESKRKNEPTFSFRSKTKLSWFPERHVDFVGRSSPPSTIYSPKTDRPFKSPKASIGRSIRFHIPKSVERVWKAVPHQYQTVDDGLSTSKHPKEYNFHQVTMGYGTKSDFTNQKEMSQIPGAIYSNAEKTSLSYISKKGNPSTLNGFFNKFEAYDKICYKGQEKHYYGRESKGPGAYLNQDFIHTSPTRKAEQFSVPKVDRGLLTLEAGGVRSISPGPGKYNNHKQAIENRPQASKAVIPTASRDFSFAKYNSLHSNLVSKGLF